jgi:uncharacterized damage-inducible protein DinB
VYIKSYIKNEIVSQRRQLELTLKNVTEEQFNWEPPGTANSIGATYIHILTAEDDIIQAIIQRKLACWEEQQWNLKIPIHTPPAPGRGWDEVRQLKLDIHPIQKYEKVVYAATDAYIEGITVKELQRKVSFFGANIPIAEVLTVMINHNTLHNGEIAAIKGIQGSQGLP